MYIENFAKHIRCLTLFSSESCNLNCSYCEIAKSAKGISFKEAEKVKVALENGEFVKNIKETFFKMQIDPNQIKRLELWGQEPTLTLDAFSKAFKELYEFCPNITTMFFSTNAVSNIRSITNLINVIDNIVDDVFNFEFQCSYDGYYSTKNYRGIDPSIIINNVKELILNLNELNLKYVKVKMAHHNVVSRGLIKYLMQSDETIYEYWKEFEDLFKEYEKINTNRNVRINPFSPGIENPVNASKEEGEMLANFYKKSDKLCKGLKHLGYKGLLGQNSRSIEYVGAVLKILNKNKEKIENIKHYLYTNSNNIFDDINKVVKLGLFNNIYDESIHKTIVERLSDSLFCGAFWGALKIRYDGTLLYCQNNIHNFNYELMKNKEQKVENINAMTLIEKKYYSNLITNYEEDSKALEKILHFIALGHKEGFCRLYTIIINLMNLLSENNQIHESYKTDKEKMIRHAYYLCYSTNCIDNLLKTCGSTSAQTIGQIRFYCNGYMDLLDEFILLEQKQHIEEERK